MDGRWMMENGRWECEGGAGFETDAVDGGMVHTLPLGLAALRGVHNPINHIAPVMMPESGMKLIKAGLVIEAEFEGSHFFGL